jgi:hypothetical protein
MKALLTLIIFCLVSFGSYAQFNKKNRTTSRPPDMALKDRIFFGGGGSFSTGTYPTNGLHYTYIAINPLIGYRITPPFSIGLQVLYQTYRFSQTAGLNLNQYGFAPFMQYRFGQIFVYSEYQMINALNQTGDKRSTYTRLPIGLGYSQPIGQRAAINVVALYDVLYGTRGVYSPFITPWVIRVYVTAGGISF